MNLREEIEVAINRCGAEKGSNTPDFILAEFLIRCLESFDMAIKSRNQYYGSDDDPSSGLPK